MFGIDNVKHLNYRILTFKEVIEVHIWHLFIFPNCSHTLEHTKYRKRFYSNLVYPFEEQKFGNLNHRRRNRPNPRILIRRRILLIFLLKLLHLRLKFLDFDTIFLIYLNPAFASKQTIKTLTKTHRKYYLFLFHYYSAGDFY